MNKSENVGKNLIIIEKYEEFVNYIYPVLQNVERKHGLVKEKAIGVIFDQIDLFYKCVKSQSKSKLYDADANLATIRFYLRFLAYDKRRLLSLKQHQTASIKLAEVGKILNSWIRGKQDSGDIGRES